jgi:hypothetical protein
VIYLIACVLLVLGATGHLAYERRQRDKQPPTPPRPVTRPEPVRRVLRRPQYLINRQLHAMETDPGAGLVDLVAEFDRLVDEHEAEPDDAEDGRR